MAGACPTATLPCKVQPLLLWTQACQPLEGVLTGGHPRVHLAAVHGPGRAHAGGGLRRAHSALLLAAPAGVRRLSLFDRLVSCSALCAEQPSVWSVGRRVVECQTLGIVGAESALAECRTRRARTHTSAARADLFAAWFAHGLVALDRGPASRMQEQCRTAW